MGEGRTACVSEESLILGFAYGDGRGPAEARILDVRRDGVKGGFTMPNGTGR